MITSTAQFPQRALLLGVLWFPATFLVLWACAALGMWSSHHMDTSLAVFFAALFILAFTLQIKAILPAVALLRFHASVRLPLNYLLLAIGVLTAVIAAGFALVFGAIALNN
jgi:hypothetical protein